MAPSPQTEASLHRVSGQTTPFIVFVTNDDPRRTRLGKAPGQAVLLDYVEELSSAARWCSALKTGPTWGQLPAW